MISFTNLVPLTGFEPAHSLGVTDFESIVSTNSTTEALLHKSEFVIGNRWLFPSLRQQIILKTTIRQFYNQANHYFSLIPG